MKRYGGRRYNSMWDRTTWLIIALVTVCCILPVFFDDGIMPVIISGIMLLFIIVTFKSVYYKIDGNNLIIYQFFVPTEYPIEKIESVLPTKSVISAPATSLTHRLAIKFDRAVLKSSMPVIISPVRQKEFLEELLSINPNIFCGKETKTAITDIN